MNHRRSDSTICLVLQQKVEVQMLARFAAIDVNDVGLRNDPDSWSLGPSRERREEEWKRTRAGLCSSSQL
jgi:hypothetical protein